MIAALLVVPVFVPTHAGCLGDVFDLAVGDPRTRHRDALHPYLHVRAAADPMFPGLRKD